VTRRQTDQGAAPRRRRRAWPVLLLAAALAGCACPDLVESWDTPQAALATWQARLCRDDVEGEYACLSRSFQLAINGFETYYPLRTGLLERDPAAAWLFRRADLAEHVASCSFDPDGRRAVLVLEAGDAQLAVTFEREAFVTVVWDDGRSETARQRAPPDELLVRDERSRRQWLAIERPDITEPRRVREVRFASRWLIADIAGLARPADPTQEIDP